MYLIIDNSNFGFSNEPDNNKIQISQVEYDKFFQLQTKGKQFKLKDEYTGTNLFDYIEEYVPAQKVLNISKSKQLELSFAEIIEKQENDKLEIQLALAELIELLNKGGN